MLLGIFRVRACCIHNDTIFLLRYHPLMHPAPPHRAAINRWLTIAIALVVVMVLIPLGGLNSPMTPIIQPIVGALLGVARGLGDAVQVDYLPLFAQDEAGWDNLCHLVSRAHLDRPLHEDPHVMREWLEGRTDGLIALTGGPEAALYTFIVFYLLCIAVTWWHYARKDAPMPCGEWNGRACTPGDATQNSWSRIAATVGERKS